MFTSLQIKLIIAAVALVAFAGLGWAVSHYHKLYIKATTDIAVLTSEKAQVVAEAKMCSDNTQALEDQAKIKAVQVAAAQAIAEATARKHEKFSTTILTSYPTVPTSECVAGNEVINQYLTEVKEMK